MFADDTSLFAIVDNDIISPSIAMSFTEDLENKLSLSSAVDFKSEKYPINVNFTRKQGSNQSI